MRRAPIESAAEAHERRAHARAEVVKLCRAHMALLPKAVRQELRALLKAEAKAGREFARALTPR